MFELEPAPTTESTPTRTSLLRRLFRLQDIGFYLMIVLAWIGALYTTYNPESSRWYWQWLIPIFGLICIVTQWNNVEPTLKSRLILVVRQTLHWGVVLLMTLLIFMALGQMDAREASFILMFTVTLSTFLAGIYFDWRLCVVALFLIASAILNVALSNTAPLLVWTGIGIIALYCIWAWWHSRRQERHASQTRS